MIKVYKAQDDFLKKYEDFFKSDEVKYELIWRISKRKSIVTLMIASEIEDRFVLGVLAGANLIIASNTLEKDVYKDIVMYMNDVEYPGITGEKECCNIYDAVYNEVNGARLKVQMNQRIYKCTVVKNYSKNIGFVRLANEGDLEVLIDWSVNFIEELGSERPSKAAMRSKLKEKLLSQRLYLLQVDDQIVSMAQRERAMNQTESIDYVYTPTNLRGNCYASRIVEELTKRVLSDGRVATLYTDLSNPTSNSIYMKIGYEPYCDAIALIK